MTLLYISYGTAIGAVIITGFIFKKVILSFGDEFIYRE